MGRTARSATRFAAHGIEIIFATPGIVLALLFVTLPFVIRAVEPVLLEIDPAEEEAALVLGAGPWRAFRTVYLPALVPAALSSAIRSLGRALGEFGSIVVVAGNIPMRTLTAPVYVFGEIESGAPRLGRGAVDRAARARARHARHSRSRSSKARHARSAQPIALQHAWPAIASAPSAARCAAGRAALLGRCCCLAAVLLGPILALGRAGRAPRRCMHVLAALGRPEALAALRMTIVLTADRDRDQRRGRRARRDRDHAPALSRPHA